MSCSRKTKTPSSPKCAAPARRCFLSLISTSALSVSFCRSKLSKLSARASWSYRLARAQRKPPHQTLNGAQREPVQSVHAPPTSFHCLLPLHALRCRRSGAMGELSVAEHGVGGEAPAGDVRSGDGEERQMVGAAWDGDALHARGRGGEDPHRHEQQSPA